MQVELEDLSGLCPDKANRARCNYHMLVLATVTAAGLRSAWKQLRIGEALCFDT